ncbi:hypothetical protein OEZ86_009517 [Tetradesmus obliquus]|uniref:Uncharacterized protein n=1 Tax=Tetradesmus obliquus TaxID=3088 RepID=A0ABY8UME8_TETOB|nr:hypothetical protein OEZ85_000964 [Tetradesmus obliquus]WIA42978.1 hypothetical protein OEZ86_009517 [Tetradesmus obliquus]
MAMAKALAAVLLLGVVHSAIGASDCVDSSTQFFGAPWHASLVDAEQESDYKLWGALAGAGLLYNKEARCVQAVQGTYGPEVPSTATLGLQASGSSSGAVLKKELSLAAGEVFDYVEYKADSCIRFLQLTTNKGRSLAVGDAAAELSLQSHRPAPGAFLGFFKATLAPQDAASAAAAAAPVPTEGSTPLLGKGALKQLQLVWVRDCATVGANAEPADPVAPALPAPNTLEQQPELHVPADVPAAAPGAAAADTDALSPTWGDHGSDEELVTAAEPDHEHSPDAEHTADPAAGKAEPAGPQVTQFGRDGSALRAATTGPASCSAKQAIGFNEKDGAVPTASCTLSGLGKEVPLLSCFGTNLLPTAAAGAAESLSPCANLACKLAKEGCESSGAFGVGSFCTGKVVSMGATAKLHALGTSYLGYPCIELKDIKAGLLAGAAAAAAGPAGDYSAKGAFVAKSWKVCDCAAGGVTAQASQDKSGNITIKLPEVPLPRVTITTFPVDIKPPNFTLPAFSPKALNFSLPASLAALAKIANFTALDLDFSDLNFTLPSLPTLQFSNASATLGSHLPVALLASLPAGLRFDKPVVNMTLPEVVAQWLAAAVAKATLPRIVVPAEAVAQLQGLIPGFKAPSIVMPTLLSALLSKVPSSIELPSFSVPGKALPGVSLLLPNLTSLPSIVLPADMPKEVRLPPVLTMQQVGLPSLQTLARHVVDSLPSVEVSFNVPDILAQWVAGVAQGSPLQQLNVSDAGHEQLKALLPDMPDKGPALLLLNISSPFLAKPVVKELINLPTVVIPDSLIKNVTALLPALTSLPSILLSKLPTGNLTMLPEVKLPEITVPRLRLTIGKVLQELPASLNLTQGITDWLDAHTSLLGKADGTAAAANANVTGGMGGIDLSMAHPAVAADGGLAAAVQQMAGAKAAAAATPAAVAAAVPAAADEPAGPVVAGAPIQEAEVKAP